MIPTFSFRQHSVLLAVTAAIGVGVCQVNALDEDVYLENRLSDREQRRSQFIALRARHPDSTEFAEAFAEWRKEERAAVTALQERLRDGGDMPANADQDERLFLRKLPVDAPPSAIARRQLRAEMMEVRKSIAHFSLDERRAAMTAWRVESDEKFTRIAELRVIEAAESRLSMPKADRRPEGYLQMPTALLARFELREVIQAELQAIVDRLGSGREDERAEALAKWNESRRQRMEEIVRSAENEIQEEVR